MSASMAIDHNTLMRWIEGYAAAVDENRQYLTDLDGAIGDNDHGINMDRGFKAVAAILPDHRDQANDALLKNVGMTLIRTVGGASGPLYGTVFLRMAAAAAGKENLSAADMIGILDAGRQGVVDRGKAERGDKTMLDVWEPASQAFREAVELNKDLHEALQAATEAAEQGMKDTIPLVARKGRASYLGERSKGHQDPGATSSAMLFRSLLQAVEGTR